LKNDKLIINISLLIVLLMIYRNSWLPGGEILGGFEIYIVTGFSMFIFLILLDFNKILKAKISFKADYFFLLILICVFSISLLINAINEFTSLHRIVRFYVFFFYIYLFAYNIPKLIVRKHEYLYYLIKFFTYLGIIISIIGIIMYFLRFVPISTYTSQTRYLSLIVHPNYVSYLLTITSVTSLFYYFNFEKDLSVMTKVLLILAIIIQFTSQILTLSRGGLLGTAFGIFFLLLFRYRKKVILVVPFFLIMIVYLATEVFRSKGLASTLSRYLLMIPVYQMYKEHSIHTIFGFGISNSFDAYSSYRGVYGIIEAVNNPHNTLLSIFIMFGLIVTILIFLFFTFLVIKGAFYSFSAKDFRNRMFYAFLTSVMIAAFVHGFFDSMLIMPEFFVMQFFLIILGLMIIYTSKNNKFNFFKN
jgi:putative inorganic carbon (hco3(-)) transporter